MAQLTVRQLIEELQKMPQDLLVESEGCDCNGEVQRVMLMKETKYQKAFVYLLRSDDL